MVLDLIEEEKKRCDRGEGFFMMEKSKPEYLKYIGNKEIVQVVGEVPANYIKLQISVRQNGERIYILFFKEDDGEFRSGVVGNDEFIMSKIINDNTNLFQKDGFLDEIHDMLLDKNEWDFPGGMEALESYIHRVLTVSKIKHSEGKKVFEFNKSRTKVLFNTNLIDKYGDFIKVILDYKDNFRYPDENKLPKASDIRFTKPVRVFNPTYILYDGFTIDQYEMDATKFYNHESDLIFTGEREDFILDNYKRYDHLMDRVERLPIEYRRMTPLEMANKVKNSIELAVRRSKIDYKYIIPCFSLKDKRICFLVPMTGDIRYANETIAYILISKVAGKWEVITLFDYYLAYIAARLISPRLDILGKKERIYIFPEEK